MFPDFNLVQMQWGWGFMQLSDLTWYATNGNITADQFKQLSGKDYQAPTK